MRQKLRNWKERDYSTIILGYFNNPLSVMDRTMRQENNKEMEDLNYNKPTRPDRFL